MIAADPIYTRQAIVPSGETESDLVDLNGHVLIGIGLPAAVTSASLELQTTLDAGATWLPIHDRAGTKYTVAIAADRYVALPPGDIAGLHNVRLKTAGAEAADRTLTLILRKLG